MAKFNASVHEADELGDPVRNGDGTFRLRKNWKHEARDRQGRAYNTHVHGPEPELDDEGFLKVRPRKSADPIPSVNRTEAFVNEHREEGYQYYVMNDEGGRMEQFLQADWEPVVVKKGVAKMKVGQARSPDTTAVLMRKPQEWYDEDQRKKRELRDLHTKQKTAPDEEKGQYEAGKTSPLR